MRIALLCPDAGVPFGGNKGCSVHCRAVAAALLRTGHQVSAIVATRGPESGYRSLLDAGLEVRKLVDPQLEAEVGWHLTQVSAELVIERLALLAPEGARAAAAAGIPHVYEVNAPLDVEAEAHRGFDRLEEARAAFAMGFAHSRGAIAVSDEVATWVHALAPAGFQVLTVPNGAGPEFFATPDGALLAELERRLQLDRAEFRVGFIGSFRPWHDLPTLIRAAGLLASDLSLRLVLVGDGPERDAVTRLCHENGVRVTLTGAIPHEWVPAHLALCDAVVVPYADPDAYFSPLKLIEAMAAGRPVVASATEPVKRLVRNGQDALLVPPGDVASLRVALELLASDPSLRARLGANARQTAHGGHTWDAVVGRVVGFALDLPGRMAGTCGT